MVVNEEHDSKQKAGVRMGSKKDVKTRMTQKQNRGNSVGMVLLTLILVISLGAAAMLAAVMLQDDGKEKVVSIIIEEEPIEAKALEGGLEGDQKDKNIANSKTEDPGKLQNDSEENGNGAQNAPARYADLLNDPSAMQTENAHALPTSSPNEITITFAGDILFDDEYAIMANMKTRSKGVRENYILDAIDEPLLREMWNADLFMINNEFPYTDRGEPVPDKSFNFRADTREVQLLHDMGADLVSIANNHTYDFGETGLLDTLDTLDKAGISRIGAGRNLAEASRPIYYVTDNMKIAVLAATQIERLPEPATKGAAQNTPGVFRCLYLDNLLEQVKFAKQNSDFVIVFIHWGTESTDQPDAYQLDQAPRLAEAGADLIVGHHPHVLQGIDWIGDTPVAYSIGNFLFSSFPLDSCLLTATLNPATRTLQTLRLIPARQQNSRANYLQDTEKQRVLDHIQTLSPNITIDTDGYIIPNIE